MRVLKSNRGLIAAALLACLSGHVERARAQEGGAATVEPTVTEEMGDIGGTYFGAVPDPKKTRHYYIAAEPELWDFAPEGRDAVCAKPFPKALLLHRASWKVRYVQYTDATFTARVLPSPRLGILGPALRGVTGEYLAVTFFNRAWLPLSMHPHGVRYDKDSEGFLYKPAPGKGSAVGPGAKFTYVWGLDEAAAPRPEEPSSKAWLYHSHASSDEEINMGLVGMIIVTDAARARPDGTPADVDREMPALFTIFDESGVAGEDNEELEERPPAAAGSAAPVAPTWAEAQQAAEEGQRHTINGRVFGNLPGLDMNEGERVRWYLFGLGSENDMHTAHWHGLRAVENHRSTDVVELLPASMKVADMTADNPGDWIFHCHVAEHMTNGMFARFTVQSAATASPVSRDPELAFLGMPQMLSTLRLEPGEITLDAEDPSASEVHLTGQVVVPAPFPAASHSLTAQIGSKSLTLQPDASGICFSPEGVVVIKNITPFGVVTEPVMHFELILKGPGWMDELKSLKLLQDNAPALGVELHLELKVDEVKHTATTSLKMAVQQ